MKTYTIVQLCYKSAFHPECNGHHTVGALDGDRFIYPRRVRDGGCVILSRLVCGTSPRHAVSRFVQWQKRGLSEGFLLRPVIEVAK